VKATFAKAGLSRPEAKRTSPVATVVVPSLTVTVQLPAVAAVLFLNSIDSVWLPPAASVTVIPLMTLVVSAVDSVPPSLTVVLAEAGVGAHALQADVVQGAVAAERLHVGAVGVHQHALVVEVEASIARIQHVAGVILQDEEAAAVDGDVKVAAGLVDLALGEIDGAGQHRHAGARFGPGIAARAVAAAREQGRELAGRALEAGRVEVGDVVADGLQLLGEADQA
jgi:hypothetical protein